MTRFRLKDGLEFFAATPETATAEFFQLARERYIDLVNITSDNGTDAKAFISGNKIFVQEGEHLIIPQDSRLQAFALSNVAFNKLFEPVGNSEQLPDPPEEIIMPKLYGKSFYLDAGHGGEDSGAVNSTLGYKEKVAALDVCFMLGEKLAENGAIVYYSRYNNNTRPSLTARATSANNFNVTTFVSIHLNSADNKSAQGIETLVYALKGTAFELASIVQEKMVTATGWANRGVKARPDLTVLKKTKMPAILCEIGFISNHEQARELFKPETQVKIASAIAKGIEEFYGN